MPARGSILDPEEARALPARVIADLFGAHPPQPTADLLVGALLTPFYDPRIRRRKTYDEGYEHWFSPRWLPAYWQRFLVREGRTSEAEAHLAILDEIALRPETTGDDPLLSTAMRHVIQRARVLATVCRERRFPEQWFCPFWPRYDNVFRKRPPQAAPARMVEVMGLMAARPPELGSHWSPLVDG